MRNITFVDDTFDRLADWREADKETYQKIRRIIAECRREPFKGIGKPEPLKGNLKGLWSRRINQEHRLVYEVTDDEIIIHACHGHY